MDEESTRRLGQAVALLVKWGRERQARLQGEAQATTSNSDETDDKRTRSGQSVDSVEQVMTKLAFEVRADQLALDALDTVLSDCQAREALALGIAAAISGAVLDKTRREFDYSVIGLDSTAS